MLDNFTQLNGNGPGCELNTYEIGYNDIVCAESSSVHFENSFNLRGKIRISKVSIDYRH